MFSRLLIQRKLICGLLCVCVGAQPIFPPLAHASEADDFIAKTHDLAKSVAINGVNLQLLGALQDALRKSGGLKTDEALKIMEDQGFVYQNLKSQLARLYAVSQDKTSQLTRDQLKRMYKEYLSTLESFYSQRVRVEDLRREAYEYRSFIYETVDQFLKNLDSSCQLGYHPDIFDKTLPPRQVLMPNYEFRASVAIDGDGPRFDPSHSAIGIGKTDEERAMWALGTALTIAASASVLSGSVVLTGEAFAAMASGTQLAAVGMGLGITAAIAAVIIVSQIIASRRESEKIVREQSLIFHERADHNTVNAIYTEKCNQVKSLFVNMRSEMDGIGSGDAHALAALEKERAVNEHLVANFRATIKAYIDKQNEVLGSDYDRLTDEQKSSRQKALAESQEGTALFEMVKSLTPENMVSMVGFVLKDLYLKGIKHAAALEAHFETIQTSAGEDKYRHRAEILNRLLVAQELEVMNLKGHAEFTNALKRNEVLRGIYADLDSIVIDFAGLLLKDSKSDGKDWKLLEARISKIARKVQKAALENPDEPLLKHILKRIGGVTKIVATVGAT